MKKALSIFLSLLILLSTVGVSISRHYCGHMLKDSSIFVHAQGCGDMESMPMGCCHDETDHFEIEDDFQSANFSASLVHEFHYTDQSLIFHVNDLVAIDLTNSNLLEPPSPPLIQRSIYSWVQSYLI